MERKLTSDSFDQEPIVAYYQPNPPKTPNKKVKVFKKGMEWTGRYLYTFVDKEFGTQTHLIKTDEGKITIKGAKALNELLKVAGIGSNVRIVYKGTGKKVPGRRPPYLFDVFEITNEDEADALASDAQESQNDESADTAEEAADADAGDAEADLF